MKYLSRDAVYAAGCARMQRWGCRSSCPLLCLCLCLLFPRSTQRSLGSLRIPSACGFLGCLSPYGSPTEAAQAGPHPSQLPAGPWGCRGAVGVPVSPPGAAGGTHRKVPRKAAPGCASITPALPGGARSKPPPGTGSGTAPRPPLSAADPKPLGDLIPLRNLPFA